ncbi:MAG: HEAT repeat domain-containing protein, partial [Planctomycetota bacterium]
MFIAICPIIGQGALPEDRASKAAERIRPGVPAVERQLAIELLTGLNSQALPAVRKLGASTDQIRRIAALEVMGNLCVDADEYLPFLTDPSYAVRKAALEGIQNADEGLGRPDALWPLLNDRFWPVRRAAVRAMAAWASPGLAERFFKALRDADPRVRWTVLQCMDLLCDDIPAEAFEDAVKGLSSWEYRAFMEACVPLVRQSNLRFFQARAVSHPDPHIRTTARFICAAQTQEVPAGWIPELVDQALHGGKEISDAALTLLALAREAVASTIHDRLQSETENEPRALASLFRRASSDGAVPFLAAWIREEGLPERARSACLDSLLAIDSECSAGIFEQIAPELGEALRKQVLDQALSLSGSRNGDRFAPFFFSVLEEAEDAPARRAFLALCALPDPPVARLIRVFMDEKDTAMRRFFAANLVKVAKGDQQEAVATCLYDEVAGAGPAALDAACALPSIVGPALYNEVAEQVHRMLSASADPGERQRLLFTLLDLDPEGADPILAGKLAQAFDAGKERDAEFLVTHLDLHAGAATAQVMYRILPQADPDLKEEIVRTLIRRSDPAVLPWIREVFASASIHYKCSIVSDLGNAPELAHAWEGSLRKILYQEKDADLLASAIAAAPRSLLEAEEARLLALAQLGAELGMEGADAVFNALAELGTEPSLDYLRTVVASFMEEALDSRSPAKMESPEEGLAEMAVLSLARAGDRGSVALPARMLFLQAYACRGKHILELWSSMGSGVTSGASHKEARAMLSGLLLYGDEEAEPVVLRELDRWADQGRLFQCGDAAFCTIFRELTQDPDKRGRFPELAKRLAELTLACAPARSPSDFRVHRLQAIEADHARDFARAAGALKKACHVLKFYPPA